MIQLSKGRQLNRFVRARDERDGRLVRLTGPAARRLGSGVEPRDAPLDSGWCNSTERTEFNAIWASESL